MEFYALWFHFLLLFRCWQVSNRYMSLFSYCFLWFRRFSIYMDHIYAFFIYCRTNQPFGVSMKVCFFPNSHFLISCCIKIDSNLSFIWIQRFFHPNLALRLIRLSIFTVTCYQFSQILGIIKHCSLQPLSFPIFPDKTALQFLY